MSYFDDENNVEEYVRMAEGYDGREFMPILQKHLRDNSTVLELGMGPGKDLELLGETFQVTGSDSSGVFLERFRSTHPDADLLLLDAATMDTDRQFDCIYSNKVLIHLSKPQLQGSFRKQAGLLNPGGIAFHTFWYGDGEEEHSGLLFVYYTPETLAKLISDDYEEVEVGMYSEMEENDSFYMLLRKKQSIQR